ncbi:MAG: monovalent cation/H(+) antiporter subunit G [Candidatus Caldatribacteriota bacterium]|jgi:multicomponent Na+:H+ antiporter subunit G|nr:monovalent cation/H(+) antiporter subunit G [Atribacterota bacterium]MDD3031305.1 monovalent cation/H(+) antiporter subunit G [Atribacterota bacterium]MDD3640405.1 monovalent cation/H(+) antiporter subunit G [Atribacterota bacterium]MDD4288197.1 monovalent cation/H(+) antiporter subunit G [Atribacterota bacterium]MDD4764426.1 monovalent cation/H(+) antiporter subunit G [Atribacterota bacterium]
MTILLIILLILILIGIFFNGLGSIGLMRFPDVYTRLHAATKCTTFGSIFTSLAVIIFGFYLWKVSGNSKYGVLALHTIVALACLIITNPTGAHAISRAAHRSGVMPKQAVIDELKEAKLK